MPKFNKVTHVIFDLDGTLLDSLQCYIDAFNAALSRFNISIDLNDLLTTPVRSMKDSAAFVIEKYSLPVTVDEYLNGFYTNLKARIAEVQLMKGAEKLVKHLHQKGIPIAIATTSDKEHFPAKIKNHQKFFSLFHHSVLGLDDPEVKHTKPAPDTFLVCSRRFAEPVDPRKCLVFEDSPDGVKAAVAANMQVVAIPDKNLNSTLIEGATLTIRSLEDFNPEDFGLPPYEN